jgi:hypothetical protein
MNYLIHATPVHPSLCLQYFILLFTIATITAFILLLLLLFHYYHYYKTIATDKPLRTSLFPGAAELTTHLLRLINILWLPLCRINKFGFYFPRRLLRSPILVGHHRAVTPGENNSLLIIGDNNIGGDGDEVDGDGGGGDDVDGDGSGGTSPSR